MIETGQLAEQVYAEHEAFRLACEARWVLSMPSKEDRRAYLDLVGSKRGADALSKLENEIRRIYSEQRAVQ